MSTSSVILNTKTKFALDLPSLDDKQHVFIQPSSEDGKFGNLCNEMSANGQAMYESKTFSSSSSLPIFTYLKNLRSEKVDSTFTWNGITAKNKFKKITCFNASFASVVSGNKSGYQKFQRPADYNKNKNVKTRTRT